MLKKLSIGLGALVLVFASVGAAYAWKTDQSATAICSGTTPTINWAFTNTEPNKNHLSMDVTVSDSNTNQTQGPITAAAGDTITGSFDVSGYTLASGTLTFDLEWTDGRGGVDSRTASYSAVDCTPEPTMVSANVTFNDVCDVVDDSYTVEETDGVSYNVDDQRVDGVGTVTVTATADEGYEIDGDSQWSFDFTNEPCEVPTEEVCRDGEVVTINPEDRLETDTDLPCGRGGGDVTPEAPQEVPEQLPNTGLGAVAASVAGSTSIFAGVRSWAKSRNQMKDVLSNR